MRSRTIVDCSGVGPGGIARVLSELVRYWPSGHRVEIVAAPRSWDVPEGTHAEVEIVSRQQTSRRKTIMSAAIAIRRATARANQEGSHTTRVLSLSPSLAIAGSRLPVTTVVHDLAFRLWPRDLPRLVRHYRWLSYAIAIRRSERLVCVSARTQHDLFGLYGVPYSRTRAWSLGSDLSVAPGRVPEMLAGLQQQGRRYLVVAGHAPHKGVELAIEAVSAMPDYVLAVLTGGQRVHHFEAMAATSGVSDRVIFLQRLSDPDYAATIAGAAAFLMPSHFEGFGLPAVEALRLGTPTIISPDPALYEATNGRAIRMCSWTADALRRAMQDIDNLRQPVGDVGRPWQEATEELFDILAAGRQTMGDSQTVQFVPAVNNKRVGTPE